MTDAGVGKSRLKSGFEAGSEAAGRAMAALGADRADLALIFATAAYDPGELLQGIRDRLGRCPIAGCSGEGIIALSESLEVEFAVAVMAIASDTFAFDTFLARDYGDDPPGTGERLAEQIAGAVGGETGEVVGLLLFPDGLHGNCIRFLEALSSALPCPTATAGGAAGDSMEFRETWQYGDGEAVRGGVSAVLIRGRGEMAIGVSHGCRPVGLERVITDAGDGWVRAIDGKPAWEAFKEYLDGDPEDLNVDGMSHLCIAEAVHLEKEDRGDVAVIRNPFRLDKETGAIFFPGGDFEAGQSIRFTLRDQERIRRSARECAAGVLASGNGRTPALVLQFDCAGRGRLLFGRSTAREIVQPLQEILGEKTPWIGFHSFGEIAPLGDKTFYHNYTVALCALYESE